MYLNMGLGVFLSYLSKAVMTGWGFMVELEGAG